MNDSVTILKIKGLPFPGGTRDDKHDPVASDFGNPIMGKNNPIAEAFEAQSKPVAMNSSLGERYWAENILGVEVFMPVKLGGYELPNPSITITGRVTIVETPIVGQEGTVIEEITINNYDINIKCFVFDDSDIYPEQIVQELVALWKRREKLTVECVLTDFFLQAKDNCVITGINFPEQIGAESMQIIEFSLKSNKDFELILQ